MTDENAERIGGEASAEAVWTAPGSSVTVTYSLPVFNEIDFLVNEGYLKIPHGGVEVGGLLFGSIGPDGIFIKAFRDIECEHASGPSFVLSERDVQNLEAQIQGLASDPELKELRPVGWFLAHTRSTLELTAHELELFDRFFQDPGELTVIVKPERFRPTLFGFLVRDANGAMGRDATHQAVILPLPGRAGRTSGTLPAIPAPKTGAPPRRPTRSDEPVEAAQQKRETAEPAADHSPAPRAREASDSRAARLAKLEESLVLDEVEEKRLDDPALSPEMPPPLTDRETDLAPAKDRGRPKRSAQPPAEPKPYAQLEQLAQVQASTGGQSPRLMLVLPLAALVGSVVGYLAYLQIPSPVIPLNARGLAQSVLVTWPAAETSKAVYAAIRIDDSAPVLLSPEEKATGEVELSATSNMKIELIARNWMRDSRGVVRFVKAGNVRPQASTP